MAFWTHKPSAFEMATTASLNQLQQEILKMSVALDALKAQVAATTAVEQSALTLIQGISAQLTSALATLNTSDDSSDLEALSTSLQTQSAALAAAVTANTPVAPTPAPVPEPTPTPAPVVDPTPAPPAS